jgi:hypothetical protein
MPVPSPRDFVTDGSGELLVPSLCLSCFLLELKPGRLKDEKHLKVKKAFKKEKGEQVA